MHRAPRWLRWQSIALVHQLNEHVLELLADVAAEGGGADLPFVSDNRDLWITLGPEARGRMAHLPFAILDLQFANEAWWSDANTSQVTGPLKTAFSTGLSPATSERLAQEVLMFAWQMARSDRIAAGILFGMRPSVTATISNLTPGQIRAVASSGCGNLDVRWADDGRFWRELLLTTQAKDDEAIAALHLHQKLQLLGSLIYLQP